MWLGARDQEAPPLPFQIQPQLLPAYRNPFLALFWVPPAMWPLPQGQG